jgi:hypothetical protein
LKTQNGTYITWKYWCSAKAVKLIHNTCCIILFYFIFNYEYSSKSLTGFSIDSNCVWFGIKLTQLNIIAKITTNWKFGVKCVLVCVDIKQTHNNPVIIFSWFLLHLPFLWRKPARNYFLDKYPHSNTEYRLLHTVKLSSMKHIIKE